MALARALINQPSVLLLDEPLGALDLKLRKQMQAELTRLQRKVGITFVYVTHDQEEALSMSDRIAVMDRGRVLQVGTPAEVYGDPADRFVMEFIGSPNVLGGRLQRLRGDCAEVALTGGGRVRARHAGGLAVGAAVALLVRPERVRLSASPPPEPALPVAGHVTKIANLGFITHCFVRLSDRQDALVYRVDEATGGAAADRIEEGQRVYLWWDDEDARVFPAGDETLTAGPPSAAPGEARREHT